MFFKPVHEGMSTLQSESCRSQAGDLSGSISIFIQLSVGPCSLVPSCHVRDLTAFACAQSQSEPLASRNPAAWQNSGTHRARAGG